MSNANQVVLVWVIFCLGSGLSLFASLLSLVGETQIWPGNLRVFVFIAYPNVRTEPQRTEKKTTKQETQQKKPKTEQAKRHCFVVSLDVAVFAIIHTSITRF